jgi:hypothetical protein
MEKVHDIGPSTPLLPASLGGVPVEAHGILDAEAVSALLLRCRVVITTYGARWAAKSGVIGAAMAHGCAIYNCAESAGSSDEWNMRRSAEWDGVDWRAVGEEGFSRYHQRRSWSVAASKVLACLR